MNTPQTWADSPIHEQVRDAGLDPVNRTTNDTPTPSPFATDGQRTTDAECWMNYCLEAEKGLATVTEQRDAVTLRLGNTQERMIDAERQRDRLADLTKQFIEILDITEESDSGRLFHPTNITSCRASDLQKIGELFEALRRAIRTTKK